MDEELLNYLMALDSGGGGSEGLNLGDYQPQPQLQAQPSQGMEMGFGGGSFDPWALEVLLRAEQANRQQQGVVVTPDVQQQQFQAPPTLDRPDISALGGANRPADPWSERRTMPLDRAAAIDQRNSDRNATSKINVPGKGANQNLEQVLELVRVLKGTNPQLANAIMAQLTGIDPLTKSQNLQLNRQKALMQFQHGLNQPNKEQKLQQDGAYRQGLLDLGNQSLLQQKERSIKMLKDAASDPMLDPRMRQVINKKLEELINGMGSVPSNQGLTLPGVQAPLQGQPMGGARVRRIK